MSEIFQIAIDGPGGAGKSTIAKKIAEVLKIEYIDTGAMYRAVGYKVIKDKIDPNKNEELTKMLGETKIDFKDGNLYLDGIKLADEIRTSQVAKMASIVSQKQAVREKLVKIQRELGEKKSIVMDGRDIGTNVLPEAKFKFYLNASPEKRAKRRFDELLQKGTNASLDEVLEDIKQRDYMDINRELNPLRKSEDAVEIDTSYMNIDEVLERILKEVK